MRVAIGLLVLRLFDLFWLIAPELHEGVFRLHWLDVVVPVALGGIWLFFFARNLGASPLVVRNDPRFEHVTTHEGTTGHD